MQERLSAQVLGMTSEDFVEESSSDSKLALSPAIDEGVPLSSNQIDFECIRWEDTGKLPSSPNANGTMPRDSRHVRYVIKVTAPGIPPYELYKRWRELSEFSRTLNQYDQSLPRKFRWRDNGEKPLAAKWVSAGFEASTLNSRQSEINAFFRHLSAWLNRLLASSRGPINLLAPDVQPDLISAFFAPESSYNPAMNTVRDIGHIQAGLPR